MEVVERDQPGFIYQVRSDLGDDPNEILTRLTHRVWGAFDKRRGTAPLDPHLWPGIFHTLCRAFQNRLSFNPQCGHQPSCLAVPCVLCGGGPHTHPSPSKVYLLDLHRPLASFLKAISSALARQLRTRGGRARAGDPPLGRILHESLTESLKAHVFLSEVCRSCPARETRGDRRVWSRDVLDSPWGGVRGVRPEDFPLVEEVEEA